MLVYNTLLLFYMSVTPYVDLSVENVIYLMTQNMYTLVYQYITYYTNTTTNK
jgi:hypothetical protein